MRVRVMGIILAVCRERVDLGRGAQAQVVLGLTGLDGDDNGQFQCVETPRSAGMSWSGGCRDAMW